MRERGGRRVRERSVWRKLFAFLEILEVSCEAMRGGGETERTEDLKRSEAKKRWKQREATLLLFFDGKFSLEEFSYVSTDKTVRSIYFCPLRKEKNSSY